MLYDVIFIFMKERFLCIKGLINDGGGVMKYVNNDLHLAQILEVT